MIEVSTAKIDITPLLATNPFMAGYGTINDDDPREAESDEAYSPLYARCIVLWDNGHPNVIVVADVLGFPRSMHQAIRERVVALSSQWCSSDFILQATHTHNGPVLIDAPDPFLLYNLTDIDLVTSYSGWLVDQICNLVRDTFAAPRVSCRLDYQVSDESFSHNRESLSHDETSVPILVARNAGGTPVAILFSYGCHPVSAGRQTRYDGDFASGACTAIEEATGAFAIFLQGPAGDQDPPANSRGFNLRDQLSNQLARTVLDTIQSLGRPLMGPILTKYEEIDLPLDITNTPDNLAAVRTCYEKRLSYIEPAYQRRHAEVMIRHLDAGSFVTNVPLPIQVWKLQGDPGLSLVFTGGELVSRYAVHLRNERGGPEQVVVAEFANEIAAYIPSDELLPPMRLVGSYAGGWCTDFPGIAGGAQAFYGHYLGHFLAGDNGVESTVYSALQSLLQ